MQVGQELEDVLEERDALKAVNQELARRMCDQDAGAPPGPEQSGAAGTQAVEVRNRAACSSVVNGVGPPPTSARGAADAAVVEVIHDAPHPEQPGSGASDLSAGQEPERIVMFSIIAADYVDRACLTECGTMRCMHA